MHDELESETGLDSMTKAELKAEARARRLPTTGTKAALLERVEEHDRRAGDGADEQAAPAADDERAAGEPSDGGSREDGRAEPAEEESERGPEDRGAPEEGEESEEGEEPEDRGAAEDEEPESEEGEEPEDRGAAEDEERDSDEGEEPEDRRAAEEGEGERTGSTDGEEPEDRGAAEEGDAEDTGPEDAGEAAPAGGRRRRRHDGARIDIAGAASEAARALAKLTGRSVDAVSGVRKTDDGYQVTIEVLELSRVPSTTDVLATYEVGVGSDGSVVDYSRTHRYYRNQTSRE